MKLRTSAFKSDLLTLTRGDLRRLEAGETLTDGALVVRLEEKASPQGFVECAHKIDLPNLTPEAQKLQTEFIELTNRRDREFIEGANKMLFGDSNP